MKDSFEHGLDNVADKGKENMDIELETISLGHSFIKHKCETQRYLFKIHWISHIT